MDDALLVALIHFTQSVIKNRTITWNSTSNNAGNILFKTSYARIIIPSIPRQCMFTKAYIYYQVANVACNIPSISTQKLLHVFVRELLHVPLRASLSAD